MKKIVAFTALVFIMQFSYAQQPDVINQIGGRIGNIKSSTARTDTIGFCTPG